MQKPESYYDDLEVEYNNMIDERDSKLIEIEKAIGVQNEGSLDDQENYCSTIFYLQDERIGKLEAEFRLYDAKFKVREAEILAELRTVGRAMEGA